MEHGGYNVRERFVISTLLTYCDVLVTGYGVSMNIGFIEHTVIAVLWIYICYK
jgi:hypothetical protein